MALKPRKGFADCKISRNSSPTYSIIKQSLVRGLQNFTKDYRCELLSLSELNCFLRKVNFLKKEKCEEDLKDLQFMWGLLSFNSLVHISDAFAYVLTVLDIEIPKSILKTGVVFKGIGTGLSFVKENSMAFNRNYLEKLYEKRKEGLFFNKTPKSRESSFRVENKKKVSSRRGSRENKTPSSLKNSRTRLKRSESNSRNNSKELRILSNSENTKKQPEVSITKKKI